jgi:hypothetical protein
MGGNDMQNAEVQMNRLKWHLTRSIWQNSFEKNIALVCQIFTKQADIGWEAKEVYVDMSKLVDEALSVINDNAKVDSKEISTYIMTQIITMGTKEVGSEDLAVKAIRESLKAIYLVVEQEQEKQNIFMKFYRKVKIFFMDLSSKLSK